MDVDEDVLCHVEVKSRIFICYMKIDGRIFLKKYETLDGSEISDQEFSFSFASTFDGLSSCAAFSDSGKVFAVAN